jgi:hypothetical protein
MRYITDNFEFLEKRFLLTGPTGFYEMGSD